jgi:hypothetical protein
MGSGWAGKKEEHENQRQFKGGDTPAGLQPKAQQDQHGAKGVGYSGCVQAAVKIGEAVNADTANDTQCTASQQENPAGNIDNHSGSPCLASLSSPPEE